MKRVLIALVIATLAAPAAAQITKPVYVSLPSAGNIQHLALTAAQYKGFYDEAGLPNAQVVYLRGNAINVQAIISGSVQFAKEQNASRKARWCH